MTDAAAHYKKMKYLVAAEISGKFLKDLQLQAVDDSSQGVEDSAEEQPEEGWFRKGEKQGLHNEYAGPSHADVDQGADPVRALDQDDLDQDSCHGSRPHENQQGDAPAFVKDQKADRGVGTCDEDKDHRMIDPAQDQVDLFRDIKGMVDGAGSIEKDHAQNKYGHGDDSSRTEQDRLIDQGVCEKYGCYDSGKVGQGASRILHVLIERFVNRAGLAVQRLITGHYDRLLSKIDI